MNISIYRQGELVKIKPKVDRVQFTKSFDRGKRQVTTAFTARSRKNLLEHFAIIDKSRAKKATFITLTYASCQTDDKKAFLHLREFLRRIKAQAELAEIRNDEVEVVRGVDMFACWRKEYQDREAIHFHVMIWGAKWIDKEYVAHEWSNIIGEHVPADCSDGTKEFMPVFTRVELCQNQRKAWYYVAKYLAKSDTGKQDDKRTFAREKAHSLPTPIVTLPKRYTFFLGAVHCQPVGEEVVRLEKEQQEVTAEKQRLAPQRAKGGFNIASNLQIVQQSPDLTPGFSEPKPESKGRFWGWYWRENIVYADIQEATLSATWEGYRRFRWDLGQIMSWVRDVHLAHTLKLFWFEDVLDPVWMFIQSLNGDMVFGWKKLVQF